jgi:hypothetical protein
VYSGDCLMVSRERLTKTFDSLRCQRGLINCSMIRVVRAEAMQFIQQFPGDNLWVGMFHAVDHPVSHRLDCREIRLRFEPINQEIHRRFVLGRGEIAALLLFLGRIVERQIRSAQADTVNHSMQPSLQRFFDEVERELDAR